MEVTAGGGEKVAKSLRLKDGSNGSVVGGKSCPYCLIKFFLYVIGIIFF